MRAYKVKSQLGRLSRVFGRLEFGTRMIRYMLAGAAILIVLVLLAKGMR